ncbi:phasin family protein, partial [Micromonospora deserti]
MQDAWRAYLELALGLTEAPRKKAQEAVRRLVGSGGATAAQLQALAEELVSTGAANREALTKLIRFEVDRALGAVGLATADEVAELTHRVHELERRLRETKAAPGAQPVLPATTPT